MCRSLPKQTRPSLRDSSRRLVLPRRAVERQSADIAHRPCPRRHNMTRVSTPAIGRSRLDTCFVRRGPPHAAAHGHCVTVDRERDHRLAQRHIGNPRLEKRLKDLCVRLGDEDGPHSRGQFLRKGERRPDPGSLERCNPTENLFISRRAGRRIDNLSPATVVFRRRFQLASEVVVNVVSEAQHGSVDDCPEKKPRSRRPSRVVHTD
jgi:hypothetical protein